MKAERGSRGEEGFVGRRHRCCGSRRGGTSGGIVGQGNVGEVGFGFGVVGGKKDMNLVDGSENCFTSQKSKDFFTAGWPHRDVMTHNLRLPGAARIVSGGQMHQASFPLDLGGHSVGITW